MTTPAPASPKLCIRCGADCNGKPRVKDQQGRYTCQPCIDKLQSQQAVAAKRLQADRGQAATGTANPEPEASQDNFDVFSLATTGNEPKVAPCGNCGKPVNEQAAVCVACGYSKQLGRVLKPSDHRSRRTCRAASASSARSAGTTSAA